MKIKQKIETAMQGKEKIHLKEIYGVVEAKPSTIRGVINQAIKKQEDWIERLGKGNYKLAKN